jgi:hypothetical protein
MLISQVKQLGMEVKEAQTQGIIKKTYPPEQKSGSKGPFFTQNIVVSDTSGEMTVGIYVKNIADGQIQGTPITIDVRPRLHNGTVYYNGTVVNVPAAAPYAPHNALSLPNSLHTPPVAPQTTRATTPVSDSQRNRSMSVAYAKDLAVAKLIDFPELFNAADDFVKYIETGVHPEIQPPQDEPRDNPDDF